MVVAYTLAYSPCPNDTYIFAALANGLLPDAPEVRVALADIEELNNAAERGTFELIKVSYGAIPYLDESLSHSVGRRRAGARLRAAAGGAPGRCAAAL